MQSLICECITTLVGSHLSLGGRHAHSNYSVSATARNSEGWDPFALAYASSLNSEQPLVQEERRTAKHDSLHRLGDRFLADIGLYREHRIHRPHNRTDQQQVSPVPVALLAMWMPRI